MEDHGIIVTQEDRDKPFIIMIFGLIMVACILILAIVVQGTLLLECAAGSPTVIYGEVYTCVKQDSRK